MKKDRFGILLKKRKIILIALIYILSLSLRLIDLENTSTYSDEITWTVRGKEIIYALIHANKNFFENAWWKKTNDTEAIALPLTLLSGISQFFLAGNGKYSLKIFNDIFASRLPIAIISSLTPVFIFYFGSKLIGEKLALISAIFYLINPIAIAFDRMSINDSFLTLFSFIALTSYLYYSKENKISFIPGIFLSLAFLTKPNGILPIIGWLVYDLYQKRNNFPSKQLAINTISFLVFTNIMWPYSWEKPIYSIFEYLIRQFHLVQDGMTVFYRGKITTNPPFDFYLFQYLIRMPEILILGFFVNLISILYLIKNKNIKTKKQNITIITYVLIFLIIISISNKKLGIRYALPLLPWFVIASASGWLKILEILKNKSLKFIFLILTTFNLILPLSFNPDYYFYYNYLAGGPKGAQKYDMVGFCASSRLAVEYLKKENIKGSIFVAGCPEAVRYYSDFNLTYNFLEAEYIILETYFAKQHPESQVLKFIEDKNLIKDIEFHNAIIAKIYKI